MHNNNIYALLFLCVSSASLRAGDRLSITLRTPIHRSLSEGNLRRDMPPCQLVEQTPVATEDIAYVAYPVPSPTQEERTFCSIFKTLADNKRELFAHQVRVESLEDTVLKQNNMIRNQALLLGNMNQKIVALERTIDRLLSAGAK